MSDLDYVKRKLALLCKRLFLLVFSFILIMTFPPPLGNAATNQIQVTQPLCFFRGTVPMSMNATVHANVTSTIPIRNVTFYYRSVSASYVGPISQPYNLSLYHHAFMYSTANAGDTYVYVTLPLPRFANYTNLWGFVKAFDNQGNFAYSNDNESPVQTCYFYSPAPQATLDLSFTVTDVNPRYLNLTTDLRVSLQNSVSFVPISISSFSFNYFYLPMSNGNDFVYWTGEKTTTFGYYGIPQLFPLDSYTYVIDLNLGGNLNYSKVTLNQGTLTPMVESGGLVHFTFSPTLAQAADNNVWNLTSKAVFSPYTGPKHQASISITLQLTRKLGEVTDSILIPIISLYALLGVSILLVRKGDLGNRLLVYLGLFVFTYELDANIRSLVTSPFSLGPTMAELLALALAPCTAILAIFSIIRWVKGLDRYRSGIDVAGIGVAAYGLWYVAQFSVRQYVVSNGTGRLEDVPYTLSSLQWYGYALLFVLVFPVVIASVIRVYKWLPRRTMVRIWFSRRYRSLKTWRKRTCNPILPVITLCPQEAPVLMSSS